MVKKKPAFGGYQIVPDEDLSVIIGKKPLSPAEMTKAVWNYIKKNNLAKK